MPAAHDIDSLLAVLRVALAAGLVIAAVRAEAPRVLRAAWLVAAYLLLWHDLAWLGAVLTVALATGSIALALRALSRRRNPDCGCRGRPDEVARALPGVLLNEVAIVIAGVVVVRGPHGSGPDVVTWLGDLTVLQHAAILAAVALPAVAATRMRPPAPAAPTPAEPVRIRSAAPDRPLLTIGMPTYDDFDGVYFSLQALRLYHDLEDTELLVVDTYGCGATRDLVEAWVGGRYVLAPEASGTAAAKDLVVRHARGRAVLCCDSHVLFEAGVIARLKRYHADHPDSRDLLQGPLVYDDGRIISTHLEPRWRGQMWGTWATDPRGAEPEGEPFEIEMQGLGAFSCRVADWPGVNPGFRGFGGEEGYVHAKFRRAGGRTLCLPWMRWMHRFPRPAGIPYPLLVEDKLRNYLLGHAELGLDTGPVIAHFADHLPADGLQTVVDEVTNGGGRWPASSGASSASP
jgi:hypothetical protein